MPPADFIVPAEFSSYKYSEMHMDEIISYHSLTLQIRENPLIPMPMQSGGMEIIMTLKDARVGKTVKVLKIQGEGAIRRRIMDMGITKGVEIYVRKLAPFGDPVEVTVRGYELSIRKADAEMILVEN